MAIKHHLQEERALPRVEGDLSQLELVDADGNRYDLTGKPGIVTLPLWRLCEQAVL